jgi:hypothetical protein
MPAQVLRAFERMPSLDPFLAQPDCLRALFVALNDEDLKVRRPRQTSRTRSRLGHAGVSV